MPARAASWPSVIELRPTGFARKFSPLDVALLAETDALHGTLSGPATVHLLQRAYARYGDPRYQRLAGLSVSHLYNLRAQAGYQAKRGVWTKTKGASVAIGQRRAPAPEGRAGFIRIDSVHQGDFDGLKGVYHINAVDCVTQFELVATCERISEAYLLPVLESCWRTSPSPSWAFTPTTARSTSTTPWPSCSTSCTSSSPSRARAPATTTPWPRPRTRPSCASTWATPTSPSAARLKSMPSARQFLNPYVNFHRPCFFPDTVTDRKGRIRKRYRFEDMMTPYEKLKSLPNAQDFLKPGMSFQALDAYVAATSDNQAAQHTQPGQSKAVSIHPTSIQTGGLISPSADLVQTQT